MKKLYIILLAITAFNVANAQWVQLNSGITEDLNSVFFVNATNGWAVGAPHDVPPYGSIATILYSNDEGFSWHNTSFGVYGYLESVYFTSADTGYAIGGGGGYDWSGKIFKTINKGYTWSEIYSSSQREFRSIVFTGADTGYVVSYHSGFGNYWSYILKTIDCGATWSSNPIGGLNISINDICFTDAGTGYAVGNDGAIFKTTDGGLTWTNQTSGTANTLTSVYFAVTNTGYAVGENGILLKTVDEGITWSSQNLGSYSFTSVHFPDPDTGYIVGNGGAIFKTLDGGSTWTSQSSGTSNGLRSVYFIDPNTGYAVGEGGTVLKTTNGGFVGLNEGIIVSKSMKLYPNPAKDKITIESFMAGDRSLSIINVNGQNVLERRITNQKTQIDICDLPAGVYFVRLTGERTVEVGKIIKE